MRVRELCAVDNNIWLLNAVKVWEREVFWWTFSPSKEIKFNSSLLNDCKRKQCFFFREKLPFQRFKGTFLISIWANQTVVWVDGAFSHWFSSLLNWARYIPFSLKHCQAENNLQDKVAFGVLTGYEVIFLSTFGIWNLMLNLQWRHYC